jgi:SAM-dependent methyltransferase
VTPIDRRTGLDGSGCRACGHRTLSPVLDMGEHPEANTFPDSPEEGRVLPRWPLRAFVCTNCWLFQLDDSGPAEAALPGPPAYELSETMRGHAHRFVEDVLARHPLPSDDHRVIELASHGTYLQPFLAERGVRSVIVEGSASLADAATHAGRAVLAKPFGLATAHELVANGGAADLVIDNYLLAHVSDPSEFAAALETVLRPGGVAVLEFDHVLRLIIERRFDSLRHGHFSYFGLTSVRGLLERHGLTVFDAEPQSVYGGALRVYVAHTDDAAHRMSTEVGRMLDAERDAGLSGIPRYRSFASGVAALREELVAFLIARKTSGDSVVAYGAPSRGNTLLNYGAITTDLVAYTVDRSPLKQGHYLPGSGLAIQDPGRIFETRPAFVLILTWDLREEVMRQLRGIDAWGGRFVVPLPHITVLPAH